MKPKRIFIIRHGQSTANADLNVHAVIPDWKIPLTELGIDQSLKAGKYISDQISWEKLGVYVSPFLRTKETWRNMSVNIDSDNVDFVKEDPRLREQEWGHLGVAEEHSAIDKERQAYGHFFYRIPDGESGADVYDRMTGFLETIYRDFKKEDFPENVLIVTHGYAMRVLLMRWLHWTVDEFHNLGNSKNCQIVELNLNDEDKFDLVTPWPLKSNDYIKTK
jgi:broad specificity phosphatase PhoE